MRTGWSVTTTPEKKFAAFEFNDEDENVEKNSKKTLSKFKKFLNPRFDDTSPVTKYTFLQAFAKDIKVQQKDFGNGPFNVDAYEEVVEDRVSERDDNIRSTSLNREATHPYHQNHNSDWTSYANEPVNILSDDDGNSKSSSLSTSASSVREHKGALGEQGPVLGSGGSDIVSVVISPDHFIWMDMTSTNSMLTFSSSHVAVKGSDAWTKRSFSFEWKLADIVSIESKWSELIKTAVVNLHIKIKDEKLFRAAKRDTGVGEFAFHVHDLHWSVKEDAIKALNESYKAKWKVVFDIDTDKIEVAFLAWHDTLASEDYLHNLEDSFEEVLYPKGDNDAISISKRDLGLLQPEKFINDTIIDFYTKYLQNRINPKEKDRFHFFNSFFFRKLADLDKDPSRACGGWEAFQRVCKWTKKVNLFEKDYIFIPVNFSLHWSLIVICHPGEVAHIKDEEIEKLSRIPCILHMDSIKGSHRGLKNLILSYLCEEWRGKHNESEEHISRKFLDLPFVSPQLPQQENSFDCGLFLLHFVECFVEEAPINFNPFRTAKYSKFLSKDWFPPSVASKKRSHIKKLIYEIAEDDSRDNLSLTSDEHNITKSRDADSDRDIEITQFAVTPKRSVHFVGLKTVHGELRELDYTAISLTGNDCQQHGKIELYHLKNGMSPIEEVDEMRERSACSSKCDADGGHIVSITESSSTSCSTEDNGRSQKDCSARIILDLEECEGGEQYPGASIYGSMVSSEARTGEVSASEELLVSEPKEKDEYQSYSMTMDGLAALAVDDSEEENDAHYVSQGESFHPSAGRIHSQSPKEPDSKEKNCLRRIHRPLVIEIDERRSRKRPRLSRTLDQDLH